MNNEIMSLENVTPQAVEKSMAKIKQFQEIIKNSLTEGIDYGTIPGCGKKPTLLKSGGEKILRTFGLKPFFEILSEVEDFEKGLFFYKVKARVFYGNEEIAQGIGSCNSWEDKYRYRWVFESDIPSNLKKENLASKTRTSKNGKPYKVYKVPNDDMITQANTILKMAKKRALVDVALFIASLSDIFTQDIEDNPDYYINNEEPELEPVNKPKTTPATAGKATDKQINLIRKQIINSHLLTSDEVTRLEKKISNGLTKEEASHIISWWLGSEKGGVGERAKREQQEQKQKAEEEEGNADFPYSLEQEQEEEE